jgi:LPS sulfotransferase NodH
MQTEAPVSPVLIARRKIAAENMSPACDAEAPGATRLRYLICSSERSGSSLLADMLVSTGVAGVPMEYFNKLYMEPIVQPDLPPQAELGRYLAHLEQRRTTANGIFGIKAHLVQLQRVVGPMQESNFQNFLRGFDRLIYIERRNRLKQAVSLYRARATGLWSSKHEQYLPDARRELAFRPHLMAALLHDVILEHHNWQSIFKALGLSYLHVAYEDVAANPQAEIPKILEYIGASSAQAHPVMPSLKKQYDNVNAGLEAKFMAHIQGQASGG